MDPLLCVCDLTGGGMKLLVFYMTTMCIPIFVIVGVSQYSCCVAVESFSDPWLNHYSSSLDCSSS